MIQRTNEHEHFWRLWTVQLSAVSAALSTAVGASVLADLPKEVSVGLAIAVIVVNALTAYVRTVRQAKLSSEKV